MTSYSIIVLFDLYDFNEIQTLSPMDLEFAIQSTIIATCKMHGLRMDLNETEITILVRSTFNNDVRITLPQLLKWTSSTEEVFSYFMIFRMDGPETISI
jgi:microtubule-associated protein-like 5